MTKPPQECPTRITSPPARSIALLVAVTSSSREVVGFCTEITSYPLSTSGLINLFHEEPSAQSPWTKTIVGFLFIEPPVCAKTLNQTTTLTRSKDNFFICHLSFRATNDCSYASNDTSEYPINLLDEGIDRSLGH